jgi:hypothetical protein
MLKYEIKKNYKFRKTKKKNIIEINNVLWGGA